MQYSSLVMAAMLSVAQAVDVQVVSVGQNPANNVTGSQFWPESITAEPGSMVQFQFWAGNHTVTQSTFDSPCTPMEGVSNGTANGTAGAASVGIKSGFMPVDQSMPDGNIPVYTVMINDTSPLWFYCGQGSHCAGGMAMVINPAAEGDKTLDAYKEAAAASAGGGEAGGDGSGEEGGDDAGGEGDDSDGGEGEDGSSEGGDGSGEGEGDNPDEVPSGEDDAATIGDGAGSGASALSFSSTLLLGIGAAMLLC